MFKLEIQLGNEAMQTQDDIAEALRRCVVRQLERGYTSGRVADVNGNAVGRWEYRPEA